MHSHSFQKWFFVSLLLLSLSFSLVAATPWRRPRDHPRRDPDADGEDFFKFLTVSKVENESYAEGDPLIYLRLIETGHKSAEMGD